ncbi:MAG: MATE family efflux transporter [Tannerella sp.]|jgi:putative MATE family efflux protein|nr:MATE family efflux transporter [Tannerella sp.]
MYSNQNLWRISYPIFLSLLAQNVINVADTAFLGRVGEVELGASAMGGLYYICAFTIAFGFSIGSQIVIGRRNGERNYTAVGPVVVQGIIFLFCLATICFVGSKLFVGDVMRLLVSSDEIWEATMEFLDWRIWGFFFSFFNVMFRAMFVGITRTKVLTLNAVIMALTNVVLDYLFIFGHAGLPEMGVKGAAIASVIAEAVSVVFFIVYTCLTIDRKKYGLDKFCSFDVGLLKQVLDISIFTMLQYFVSMSTFFLFFVVVEKLGKQQLAIANIVRSVYIVMFIPINSLSTATNTIVSNLMGAGKIASVIPAIRKISFISMGAMAVFSSILALFPHTVLSIYTNDPLLIQNSVPSLYVIALAVLFSSTANIVFSGLSGTGNTRSALVIELGVLVIYTSFILLTGLVWRQPVHICFLSEFVYFVFLLIGSILYLRFASWENRKI